MSDAATRSYWLGRVPYEPSPPLDGSRAVDLVIVGGGLTGLWSAILLKDADPALEIAVLEQKAVGYGASGRSAGLVTTAIGRSLTGLIRRVGPEPARMLHRAMVGALRGIVDFADAEGIHASITRPGVLTVSSGAEQDALIEDDLNTGALLGADLQALDGEACRELVRTDAARCGHLSPHGLLLDPAALTRGLERAARRRGVQVYAGAPVDGVETIRGQRVEARTPYGTVHADRAVIATNAYAHAFPALRRFLFTTYVSAVLTERLSDEQWSRIGWERRMGIEDRRALPHFCRPTPDGRILWGGGDVSLSPIGPNPRRDRDPVRLASLAASLRAIFPQLPELHVEHEWSGAVCGTADGLPIVRWLRGERILGALVPGRGLGASRLVAEAARDVLLNRASELASSPLVARRPLPLPPEPLRSVLLGTVQRNLTYAEEHAGKAGLVARVARGLLS
jgi:glycine/D-amino acid oxidase-like deaminating enzyme